jgi:hypothetical protein
VADNQRRRILFWIGAAAPVFAAAGVLAVRASREREAFSTVDARHWYQELRTKLDTAYPARGIMDYTGGHVGDVPKGYAMVLLAELTYRRRHRDHPLTLARTAGSWLLNHRDENRDGVIGWGVPAAWDAYGDGSTNPANTEYTISTAIVVDALLDWLEADPKAPGAEILSAVEAALLPYADAGMRSPSGLLPYSLAAADRRYDTFNPAAYLAGQMQRFSGRLTGQSAETLRAVADQTMGVLLQSRQTDPAGDWYWDYSLQERVPNDLAHAMYIVNGIHTYAAYEGRRAGGFDLTHVARHLHAFLRTDDGFVSAWPTFRRDVASPARSYDLGMALATCVRFSALPRRAARRIAVHVPTYRRPDGWYRKYPAAGDKAAGDDLVVGEYQAYMLHGLASWAAREGQG